MKRLVVCVLLAACGGDDSGSGFVAIDDFGVEMSTASCAKQFECCTDAELMAQFMGIEHDGEPITTEEQCVEFSNAVLSTFGVAQFKKSIERGRVEYDGAAAAACVAAIRNATCAQVSAGFEEMPPSCPSYLTPKVADGGACIQDYECISNYCEGEETGFGQDPVDGACAPLPGAGEACDEKCPSGHYCDYDVTAAMDICKPLEADGAQCTLDSDCANDNCESGTCTAEPVTCDGR